MFLLETLLIMMHYFVHLLVLYILSYWLKDIQNTCSIIIEIIGNSHPSLNFRVSSSFEKKLILLINKLRHLESESE